MSARPTSSADAAEPTRAPQRHLRLVRAPDTEPPAARAPGDRAGAPPSGRRAASPPPVQGTLALLFTMPGGAPAVPAPARVPRPTAYRTGSPASAPHRREPVPTLRAELPDPRVWSARLVQAAVEAVRGDRPVSQLLRWTTREVYDGLARRCAVPSGPRAPSGPAGRGSPARAGVRSLHLSEPADGVVEACATVEDGGRRRAVAVRLEGLDGRWLCTALDLL